MTQQEIFDITIIGGGPVGLFASFYAGLRHMRTKIIDALPELGGQLTALYPEKTIFDVAGFPKIVAKDLARNLIEQGLHHDPTVCLDQKVESLHPESVDGESILRLATQSGEVHWTRGLLLTVGIGAFVPRRLDLPGIERFENRFVHYFVKDKSLFKGKRLLIVGGGDSAVDWALNLQDTAETITLIHRRDEFRAHEESVKKLMSSRVMVKLWQEVESIVGNDSIEQVAIKNNRSSEIESLPVDHVLLNLGFVASLGPLRDWGLEIEKGDIKVTTKMETNIPGIYAAGDIAAFPGKLKLIATGFGEAAIAVNNMKAFIDPKAKFFPGHSSDMKPKK
ncbi:MAG TPA: NAD(P)/FAD-dependent oxidoreductase [Bacteroidota bacterium]|nr:NAD(P)/FAD-dependent oxidoreductase [Bacteroidota bacterium]